jgi:sulfoxide reductase catalytic subunit YedY
MIAFDAAHKAVHYPPDRRFRIWVRPSLVASLLALACVPLLLAWTQAAVSGLPDIRQILPFDESAATGPHGFPVWVRYCHFFNFLFLTMLVRSGLSILMDHPRLYFNNDCTPGTEWIRLSPLRVPADKVWTAKDDARYISPLAALPGYRHTIGVARAWHFMTVYGFIITGLIFVSLLLATGQWQRIVPTSPTVFVQAWSTFVHYANFHFPPEPNGYYGYNALQQLTYFGMVFVMGPLSIATGLAMSPALVNHFARFGGRQAARSVHFLAMVGYVVFTMVHVTLVTMTGFRRNMNHIVVGTDNGDPIGMILGFVGIGVVAVCWAIAHSVSWKHARRLQHIQRAISLPLLLATFNRFTHGQRYQIGDVSPRLWPNGKMPASGDWQRMAADRFRDYRLHVGGLVENPVDLSLDELKALGVEELVTMHHCIQGWTGIAQWKGVPMRRLVDLVRPHDGAHTVVFYSFGEGLYGGRYYDTQRLDDMRHQASLLAFEMNQQPLPDLYGAPLRLRVENQLGYKMVKWIERIEFVPSEKHVGLGEGGKNEDDEYFDLLPNI